jgi:hypothetical protein
MYQLVLEGDNTFSVSSTRHWKSYFVKALSPVYMVLLEGETGDSHSTYDTSWEGDFFNSLDEAEKMVDAIDLNYDIHTILEDRFGMEIDQLRSDGFIERADLIEVLAKNFEQMEPRERRIYLESIANVSYVKDGEPRQYVMECLGYFERLKQVRIVELFEKKKQRWRIRS